MDTGMTILAVGRVLLGFVNLLFIPGFVITLVYFPRFTDLTLMERLVYSTVLSISSVMVLVLGMEFVLGINTTPRNISIVIGAFSYLMLILWLCEVLYLGSRLKLWLGRQISSHYIMLRKYYSRRINAARDPSRQTTRTRVVYHESQRSGRNHIDHTYLLDVGSEMDIQQVIEHAGNISNIEIVAPPHPRTRYFELRISEFREEGSSLIDDLQIYPELVTKKSDIKFRRFLLKRGSSTITERLGEKESMSETQWIYSHDFHLFGIIHPEDTLNQMVDRIIAKLDEIVTSIQSGSRVSSHLEVTQTLREAFDAVIEKPRPAIPTPVKMAESAQRSAAQLSIDQNERGRRKLQREILRDFDMFGITPNSFGGSKRAIEKIKIPENVDIKKQLALIKEIQDDDWLYE